MSQLMGGKRDKYMDMFNWVKCVLGLIYWVNRVTNIWTYLTDVCYVSVNVWKEG